MRSPAATIGIGYTDMPAGYMFEPQAPMVSKQNVSGDGNCQYITDNPGIDGMHSCTHVLRE